MAMVNLIYSELEEIASRPPTAQVAQQIVVSKSRDEDEDDFIKLQLASWGGRKRSEKIIITIITMRREIDTKQQCQLQQLLESSCGATHIFAII